MLLYPAHFVDGQELVGRDIGEPLFDAAGPLDFERRGLWIGAQAEGQRQVTLRAVARSAAHHVPLLAGSAREAHHGADAVTIGFAAHQTDREPVVAVAAVIA